MAIYWPTPEIVTTDGTNFCICNSPLRDTTTTCIHTVLVFTSAKISCCCVFFLYTIAFPSKHGHYLGPLRKMLMLSLLAPYWLKPEFQGQSKMLIVLRDSHIRITNRACPLLFILFCVYFCLYGPFNCISFHKFFRQLSPFPHSVLPVLSLRLTCPFNYISLSESLPQLWHNPWWLTGLKTPIN